MLALLLILLFGLGFAYFATQNTIGITVNLAQYSFYNVPLYIVILCSLLVGIILATIITLLNSFSSFLILRRKENTIRELKNTVAQLIKRVHLLELASEKNKTANGEVQLSDSNVL